MNQRVALAVASSVLVLVMSVGALRVRQEMAVRQYRTAGRLRGRDRVYYLERSLDLEPGMDHVRMELASSLMGLEQYDRASHQLQRLLHASASSGVDPWTVRQDMGEALYHLGAQPEAIDALKTALTLRPHAAQSHLFLGRSLEKYGRPGPARDQYEAAIKDQPGDEDAYLDLGSLLLSTGQSAAADQLGRTMTASSRLLAMDWQRTRAQSEVLAGHPAQALGDLKLAMAANPASDKPHLESAAVLITLGQTRRAVSEAEAARALSPGDAGVRLALASALEADKQWDRSIDVYRETELQQPQEFARWVATGRGPDADNPALIAWQEKLETLINPGDVHLMGPDNEPGIEQVWYAGDSGDHHVNLVAANSLYLQGAMAQVRKDYTGAGQFYQNALHFIPQAESLHNTVFSNRLREAIEEGIDSVLQSQLSGLPARS